MLQDACVKIGACVYACISACGCFLWAFVAMTRHMDGVYIHACVSLHVCDHLQRYLATFMHVLLCEGRVPINLSFFRQKTHRLSSHDDHHTMFASRHMHTEGSTDSCIYASIDAIVITKTPCILSFFRQRSHRLSSHADHPTMASRHVHAEGCIDTCISVCADAVVMTRTP